MAPGVQAVDAPDFPEAYRPNALAQREALQFYRTVDDLDWTYISPAAEIGPTTVAEALAKAGAKTDSIADIGYADYADGVVDCLEQRTHLREQITLAD